MMAFNLGNVYTLHSPLNKLVGVHRGEKSYLLSFVTRQDAQRVQSFVSDLSKLTLNENKTVIIPKKININKGPYKIVPSNLNVMLSYPFANRLGVAFAIDIVDDTAEHLVYNTEVFEPYENVELFREMLSKY